MKSQLIGKDPDARKDCRQEKKGTTEVEMVGWHHRLSGHKLEQTLGDSEGELQSVESDTTERLNNSISCMFGKNHEPGHSSG